MNNILIAIVIVAVSALVIALINLPKFRRAFIVPEGYAGLFAESTPASMSCGDLAGR